MDKNALLKQAERAEDIAAQRADEEVKKTLLDAARNYRIEAKTEECEPDPAWKLPKEIS